MLARPHRPGSLHEAVDLLLGHLSRDATDILVGAGRDELHRYQDAFVEHLRDRYGLKESDVLEVCAADDLEAAAQTLISAAWARARERRLH